MYFSVFVHDELSNWKEWINIKFEKEDLKEVKEFLKEYTKERRYFCVYDLDWKHSERTYWFDYNEYYIWFEDSGYFTESFNENFFWKIYSYENWKNEMKKEFKRFENLISKIELINLKSRY